MNARELIGKLIKIEDQEKDICFWSQESFEFIDAVTETKDYVALYPLTENMTVQHADTEIDNMTNYRQELIQLAKAQYGENYKLYFDDRLEEYRENERTGNLAPDPEFEQFWSDLTQKRFKGV